MSGYSTMINRRKKCRETISSNEASYYYLVVPVALASNGAHPSAFPDHQIGISSRKMREAKTSNGHDKRRDDSIVAVPKTKPTKVDVPSKGGSMILFLARLPLIVLPRLPPCQGGPKPWRWGDGKESRCAVPS